MCTLTAILPKRGDGPLFRVVVNRDEQRTRAEALPPRVHRVGGHDAIFPVDPTSRGTWIGVNTAGLVLAVLNSNPMQRAIQRPGVRSRGEIVPSLLGCESVTSVVSNAMDLDASAFPAFRLVAIERDRLAVLLGDGQRMTVQCLRPFEAPFLATSSGLGDHVVETPRRELFRELMSPASVLDERDLSQAQDAFHRHRWTDRRHISVEMSRSDARTVSRTVVEVYSDSVRLTYRALHETGESLPMAGQDSRAEATRWAGSSLVRSAAIAGVTP